MKKSEILKVLGNCVIDYWVQEDKDFDCNWLYVNVCVLDFRHLKKLSDYITRIAAKESGVINITFNPNVEID